MNGPVHSNALRGSVFKSGWLSCIWISELLRWSYCYFEQNLSTVTPLMPPWCVIHSVPKPPVRLFIPLNQCHCSFIIKRQVRMCKNNWIWQTEASCDKNIIYLYVAYRKDVSVKVVFKKPKEQLLFYKCFWYKKSYIIYSIWLSVLKQAS